MYIYNKQIYNDIYSYFRKYCAFTSLRLWVFILFPYFGTGLIDWLMCGFRQYLSAYVHLAM